MTKELRFKHGVDVRFRDIDIGGHAHHSQVLIYFEEARAAYWREVVGREGLQDIDFILAEVTVRFKQRVLYPDRLDVRVGVVTLGRKHFEMGYEAYSSDGDLLATGSSIQVMYDYAVGASKRVPEDVAQRLTEHDGPF